MSTCFWYFFEAWAPSDLFNESIGAFSDQPDGFNLIEFVDEVLKVIKRFHLYYVLVRLFQLVSQFIIYTRC